MNNRVNDGSSTASGSLPAPTAKIDHDRTVSFLELFYDLTYVVVIARAAHHLAAHVSWRGAAEFAVGLLPDLDRLVERDPLLRASRAGGRSNPHLRVPADVDSVPIGSVHRRGNRGSGSGVRLDVRRVLRGTHVSLVFSSTRRSGGIRPNHRTLSRRDGVLRLRPGCQFIPRRRRAAHPLGPYSWFFGVSDRC